ncbi:hypothetical protein M0Q28_03320 [Patescibacteria group bacterium]|jgi:hypothetical protein|nr:hypothetical protein [Patescibacteria group bacterium]
MPQPLPPVGALITSGWEQFKRDWKPNLELSVRFIISSAILFGAALVSQTLPDYGRIAMFVLANIVAAAINLHTILTLIELSLRRDRSASGEAKPSVEIGRTHFWPFLWVMLLQGFAVLGGLFVFFLPGIWLSVMLGYSLLVLVEDGTTGIQALAASAELVKGRWWATFGRNLVAGIVVGLLGSLTTFIVLLIVGLFVGMDQVFGFADYLSGTTRGNPVADGIETVLSGIVQALFIPLAVILQVKIFHALKRTR